jgi:hypothetical protein
MKVPRSFSISGVSDMASLRVRGPAGVAFGVFKREQRRLREPRLAQPNQICPSKNPKELQQSAFSVQEPQTKRPPRSVLAVFLFRRTADRLGEGGVDGDAPNCRSACVPTR